MTGGVIVLGYDGSEDSAGALEFAAREAALRGAELRIVCTYEAPPLSYTAGLDMPGDVLRMMAQGAKQQILKATELARKLGGDDLKLTGVTVPGRPSHALIDNSEDAQLLVVGARRLGGLSRMFLGSTSTELIHHAPIPVVVVPGPAREPVRPADRLAASAEDSTEDDGPQ